MADFSKRNGSSAEAAWDLVWPKWMILPSHSSLLLSHLDPFSAFWSVVTLAERQGMDD
jgi:hypothetical protein